MNSIGRKQEGRGENARDAKDAGGVFLREWSEEHKAKPANRNYAVLMMMASFRDCCTPGKIITFTSHGSSSLTIITTFMMEATTPFVLPSVVSCYPFCSLWIGQNNSRPYLAGVASIHIHLFRHHVMPHQ
jgi:hypothetical protein